MRSSPVKTNNAAPQDLSGCGTASKFSRTGGRVTQKRKAQERLEAILLDGLDSGEPSEMTAQDWKDIRGEVLERLASQK